MLGRTDDQIVLRSNDAVNQVAATNGTAPLRKISAALSHLNPINTSGILKMRSIILSLLLASIALSGCSDKATKLRNSFIDGCKKEGVTTAICSCVYDHLAQSVGTQHLVDLDENPDPAENIVIAQKTLQFLPICMKK